MEAGVSGEATGGFGRDARAVGVSVELCTHFPVAVPPNQDAGGTRCLAWGGGVFRRCNYFSARSHRCFFRLWLISIGCGGPGVRQISLAVVSGLC